MPTKVPKPDQTPTSISPTLWQNVNRRDILSFLDDHSGSYLFYKVMESDPDPETSRDEEYNAISVDEIFAMQKAQYIAQAASMHLDKETGSPVKKAKEPGDKDAIEKQFAAKEDEKISFDKLPSGVYGHKDLQKGLYNLLVSMGQTNYSATISGVAPNTPDCGTKLLSLLNDTISPKCNDTNKLAKDTYNKHKDSFTNNTNFVPWWTTLLLLQATKATLGIKDSTRVAAMEEACETMDQNTGVESRWSLEIIQWKITSAAKKESDEERVSSFEHHMRVHQQRRDLANKERANAVNVKPDYCTWCFKNKGAKFNNHTEATCRNKKRAEGGDPGGGGSDTKNGRGCHACGCKDHFVKDCPLVVKARALQTSTTENTATATVSAENKSSAGVPSNYSSSPQKRNSTASALMTTALLASTAAPCTPMVAHFDSAATAHMGPDVRFLRNAKPSNVGIEVYNNEVVTNNMEGVFVSHSAEGNLPDGQRGYTNPSLPTTLISGPQVVFEHPKQDVVLSEQHGSFMQPTSTKCPICNKHEQRINFDGGPAGFTLDIFPGRKDASERALWNAAANIDEEQDNIEHQALAGEPVGNAEQIEKYGAEPIVFAVPGPQESTVEAPEIDGILPSDPQPAAPQDGDNTARSMHFTQVIPICNPADPLTTIDQLASLKQGRSTRRATAPSLTEHGATRFKFLHTIFGGGITGNNISEFMSEYPEFAESAKLR